MSVAAIIARLRAEAMPPFMAVAGAADFAVAVQAGLKSSPAAFVVTLADDADPNRLAANAIDQRIASRVGVLIGVRNVADATGAAGADAIETLKTATRDALVGWKPEGARQSLELLRGRLFGVANGIVWWADELSLVFNIRKT